MEDMETKVCSRGDTKLDLTSQNGEDRMVCKRIAKTVQKYTSRRAPKQP